MLRQRRPRINTASSHHSDDALGESMHCTLHLQNHNNFSTASITLGSQSSSVGTDYIMKHSLHPESALKQYSWSMWLFFSPVQFYASVLCLSCSEFLLPVSTSWEQSGASMFSSPFLHNLLIMALLFCSWSLKASQSITATFCDVVSEAACFGIFRQLSLYFTCCSKDAFSGKKLKEYFVLDNEKNILIHDILCLFLF